MIKIYQSQYAQFYDLSILLNTWLFWTFHNMDKIFQALLAVVFLRNFAFIPKHTKHTIINSFTTLYYFVHTYFFFSSLYFSHFISWAHELIQLHAFIIWYYNIQLTLIAQQISSFYLFRICACNIEYEEKKRDYCSISVTFCSYFSYYILWCFAILWRCLCFIVLFLVIHWCFYNCTTSWRLQVLLNMCNIQKIMQHIKIYILCSSKIGSR